MLRREECGRKESREQTKLKYRQAGTTDDASDWRNLIEEQGRSSKFCSSLVIRTINDCSRNILQARNVKKLCHREAGKEIIGQATWGVGGESWHVKQLFGWWAGSDRLLKCCCRCSLFMMLRRWEWLPVGNLARKQAKEDSAALQTLALVCFITVFVISKSCCFAKGESHSDQEKKSLPIFSWSRQFPNPADALSQWPHCVVACLIVSTNSIQFNSAVTSLSIWHLHVIAVTWYLCNWRTETLCFIWSGFSM